MRFASDADRAAASDGRGTASADAYGRAYLLHGGSWCRLTTGASRSPAEVQILPAELRGSSG